MNINKKYTCKYLSEILVVFSCFIIGIGLDLEIDAISFTGFGIFVISVFYTITKIAKYIE